MRLLLIPVLFLAACQNPPAPEPGTGPGPGPAPTKLEALGFLTGSWAGRSSAGVWEAHYTRPVGGELLGMSKEFDENGCRAFEFERFTERDGTLVVIPYPGGTQSVPFTITKLEARRAVFENPEHDFPQRLDYRLDDDETLVIDVTSPGSKPDARRGFRLVLKRLQR